MSDRRPGASPEVREVPRVVSVGAAVAITGAAVTAMLVAWHAVEADHPPTSLVIATTLALVYAFEPVRGWVDRGLLSSAIFEESPDTIVGRFSDSVAHFSDPERALDEAAMRIHDATAAENVRIDLVVGDHLETAVAVPRGPIGADSAPDRIEHVINTSIRSSGATVGQITVGFAAAPRARDIAMIDDVAGAAELLTRSAALRRTIRRRIDLARSQMNALEAARTQLATAQLNERRSLERDLHDICQQRAVILATRLGELADGQVTERPAVRSTLQEALHDVDRFTDALDGVTGEAEEPLLAGSIPEALLTDVSDLPVPLEIIDELRGRYPSPVEEQVYACCSEAITNAVKHADATQITVRLADRDGALVFAVEDDGHGFDALEPADTGGLAHLRERMASIGGDVEISSSPRGTVVSGAVRP